MRVPQNFAKVEILEDLKTASPSVLLSPGSVAVDIPAHLRPHVTKEEQTQHYGLARDFICMSKRNAYSKGPSHWNCTVMSDSISSQDS